MNLLVNALESIRVGVEDYEVGTRPRLLSSVRNIHAGILLLYKESLRRLSPPHSKEVLIKSKVIPSRDANGIITFIGDGSNTVNTQQIQERFEKLGIHTDWVRFKRIARLRNDIEHYYPNVDKKAMEGLISNTFIIVKEFMETELKEDPLDSLKAKTWHVMLKVSEVHVAERKACLDALRAVPWQSAQLLSGITEITCLSCGSNLLRPDAIYSAAENVTLQCRVCGQDEVFSDFALRAVETALGAANYAALKDGDELAYVSCPQCFQNTYIVSERQCASCSIVLEHECQRCGETIPPEELELSPYCGWCAHALEKDE